MAQLLKNNIGLNIANYVMGMLFPLVTFPYVSRVLLPEGIGEVQFLSSVVMYVSAITAIGLPMYAVREVSRCGNDEERRRVTAEIGLLSLFMCVIGYIAIFVLTATVPRISRATPVFLVLSVRLLLYVSGAEWFFQGTEQFRYMTIRALVIRSLAAVAMFVFIRNSDDVIAYAAIMSGADVGFGLLNWGRLASFFRSWRVSLRELHPWRHVKPALKIFSLGILITVYTHLDSVMLGFLNTNTEAGYYTAALRVTRVVRGFSTALGAALLPRLAAYLRENRRDSFADLSRKTLNLITAMILPTAVGISLSSADIITLFSGGAFAPAAVTLSVMAPLLIFVGLSDIAGLQILYSQGKENLVIIATGAGAAVDLALNFWLIPGYGATGAAISTLVAEACVFATVFTAGRRYIPHSFFNRSNAQALIATAIMAAAILTMHHFGVAAANQGWPATVIIITGAAAVYYAAMRAMRNQFVAEAGSYISALLHTH